MTAGKVANSAYSTLSVTQTDIMMSIQSSCNHYSDAFICKASHIFLESFLLATFFSVFHTLCCCLSELKFCWYFGAWEC